MSERIQYNTMQYNTIQYNTIQYNTIQRSGIQYKISERIDSIDARKYSVVTLGLSSEIKRTTNMNYSLRG